MKAKSAAEQDFQIKYVVDGQLKGFRRIKARWGDEGLHFNEDLLPFQAITDTKTRDSRMVIALHPSFQPTYCQQCSKAHGGKAWRPC